MHFVIMKYIYNCLIIHFWHLANRLTQMITFTSKITLKFAANLYATWR